MKEQIWLVYLIVLLHSAVVGITIAGCIALFTGRFAKFHKRDYFAWLFMICTIGQLLSLMFTGGCILTDLEKQIRLEIDPAASYSKTFLQEYLPFIPEGCITSIPLVTVGGLIGALVQVYFAIRRKKNTKNEQASLK